ncbi:hypothetical protein OH77DRAFT_1516565 [Trametes cingulata]|nr:hypothetical protein OH77DRAFT_1516565 [Trametes cingulata]
MITLAFAGQVQIGAHQGDDSILNSVADWLLETFGDVEQCDVEVWITGAREGPVGTVQPCAMRLCLPRGLPDARAVSPAAWNDIFDRVAEQYGGQMTRNQWDAIAALCYIYRWFAGVPEDEAICVAWDELAGIMEAAVVMCLVTGASGQSGLRNVAQWARRRIPNAYPANTRIFGMAEPCDGEQPASTDSDGGFSSAGEGDLDTDDSL